MATLSIKKSMYDWKGNTPCFWLLSAYDLLCTTHLLEMHIKRLRKNHGWNFMIRGKRVARSWHTLEPNLMIKGFFLENLVKTIAILEGQKLAQNGRYKKLKNSGSHDFLQMSNNLKIKYSDPEKEYLKEMKYCITGYGRYPITPMMQNDSDSKRLDDNSIYQSIAKKIIDRIKIGIESWSNKKESALCQQMVQWIEDTIKKS
jgi:hypothetical protein